MNQPPNKSDISELCRFIRETVGDAVNKAAVSPEVQEIKNTVKSVTREIADEVSASVRDGMGNVNRRSRNPGEPVSKQQTQQQAQQVYSTPKPAPPAVPVWRGSVNGMQVRGNVMSFFGIIGATVGAGMLGFTALLAVAKVTSLTIGLAFGLFSLIPFGICLAFAMLAKHGIDLYGTATRYRKYLQTIGDDRFCLVTLLAESVQKKPKFVLKDLRRMIRLGMFPEGQLDAAGNTLILDMDTYRQYLTAQQRMEDCRRETEAAEKAAAQKAAEPVAAPQPTSELESALADGRDYIRRMREANAKIDDEEMSGKIDRIEQVSRKIFEHVGQNPDKLPDIRRFMSYYLPITLKLLEGYCNFDCQPVQGENITTAKQEIEDTLDTIVVAFENLLDSLFRMDAMDLSSDISTLEAMLAQEGLMGSDFKTE